MNLQCATKDSCQSKILNPMELCFKNINKFNLRKLKKKKTKVCNKRSLLLKNIFKKEIIDTREKCDMKKRKMSKEND